jgi:hypothetical protein
MCRRFIRLLQGLSFQHADSMEAGPGRHTSLRSLDRSMVATRSLAPIRTYAHHAPALRFSYKRVSHVLDKFTLVTPSHSYSQHLGRDSDLDAEVMIMATEPHGSEAKPADILNEDIHSHQAEAALDPESDEDIPLEAEELKEALGRPPPVNSSYLPLPWKGRLGYVSCILSLMRAISVLTQLGLLKYLPPLRYPCRILFSNVSNRLYHREQTPPPRSRTACTLDQESTGPGSTGRCCTRSGLRRGSRPDKCA